jgi:signal transduction histidine kinase
MNPDSTTWLSRGLNLVGIAVVAVYFSLLLPAGLAVWIAALGYVALGAWLAFALVPRRFTALGTVLAAIMVVGAALVTVSSSGLMVVPVFVGIVRTLADLRRPPWQGAALALLGVALVATGVFLADLPPLGLISIEGAVVIAGLVGVSRRQFRTTELQARAMLEEQARATVLAQRQEVARDIHDVLAHSLGGLVVQLDAVEALLDADRVADAATRVHDARALAVSGLEEARRAVGALRDGDEPVRPVDLQGAIADLVRAHRSLGGTVELDVSGTPRYLAGDASNALVRTLQESLTNSRKHAPGSPVRVMVRWEPEDVRLEIENPLAESGSLATTGGGHGIAGMSERFAGLPRATFSAGEHAGRFVVAATVGDA